MGIAFLEMGLYDLAARQFRPALSSPEHEVTANGLLAYALILAGRPFEATLCIEPVLGDSEVPREEKVDFLYLMGRAQERLGKPELARQWYERAREIEPSYRDAEERIRALARKVPSN
jgi:tetratricopeptide (TPR) repeat protein